MTKPLGSEQSDRGRLYLDPDTGQKYPSVTNVKDMLNKPFLSPWYAKMAGIRAVEEFEELYRRIRLDGKESARKWVSGAAREHSRRAADRGSDLHDLAEKEIKGESIYHDAVSKQTRQRFRHFRQFLQDTGAEYRATELSIVNRSLGYAGATDGLLYVPELGSVPVISDLKTQDEPKGPYIDWAIQTGAYSRGEVMMYRDPETGEILTADMPEVSQDQSVIVRITPNGYTAFLVEDLSRWFEVFKHLHEVWKSCAGPDDKALAGSVSELATGAYIGLVDDLAMRIEVAESELQLRMLWMNEHQTGEWTDAHTALAAKRKAELLNGQSA